MKEEKRLREEEKKEEKRLREEEKKAEGVLKSPRKNKLSFSAEVAQDEEEISEQEEAAAQDHAKKKGHRMSLNLGYFGGKEKRRSMALSLSPEFHAATANH